MNFGTGKVVRAVSRLLYSMRDTARRDERDTSITTSATSSSGRAQQARYAT